MSQFRWKRTAVLISTVLVGADCTSRRVVALECLAPECAGLVRVAPTVAVATAGDLLIDFSTPTSGIWAPNGFLHSTQSYSSADPALAALREGLQIGAWRVGNEAVADTTLRRGIRTTLLLYDLWQHDRRGAWPFRDLRAYEQWLRPIVSRNRGRSIVWEIWNEWDLGLPWWGGAEADLLATYALADRIIRTYDGADALVAGPSYNRFDRERFRTFAEYCLAQGCQVNVFTWHELRDQGADQIAAHVRWVTDSIAANPRYAPLHIREVDVNEIISRTERYSTGDLVVALRGLHDGGGAYFSRSCWREATNGEYECLNGSYDGIIDTTTHRPRGSWWVHATYAQIRHEAVSVRSSPSSTAIAGFMQSGTRVGAILATGTSATDSALQFTLQGLAAIAPPDTPLSVTAYSIPWKQADCAVPRLPTILHRTMTPVAGELQFTLPALVRETTTTPRGEQIAGRSAYLITITGSPEPALNTFFGGVEFPADPPCPVTPGRAP